MFCRWSLIALVCVLAVPSAVRGQELADYDYENLSFQGVGLDYGRIWPNGVEPAAAYTLRLDLGYLGPNVRIVPSVSYWSSTLERGELERLAGQLNRLDALDRQNVVVTAEDLGEIDWSDLSINLDGQFVRGVGSYAAAYAGAGAGIHLFNGRGGAVQGTFIEDLLDSITAGLAASAGFEVAPASRFRVFLEGRYTLLDDVRYPEARIGGSFVLPRRAAASEAR